MVLQHGFVSVLQRGEACHATEEPTEETLGRDIQVIGYLLHREVGISQHHLYLCHHHIVNKFLGRTATHLLEVRLSSIPHAWVITHTLAWGFFVAHDQYYQRASLSFWSFSKKHIILHSHLVLPLMENTHEDTELRWERSANLRHYPML